jgi:hypothetical protein
MNFVASLAFFAFIPLAVMVFGRLPRAKAAAYVVLAGSLLLPEYYSFDLPAIPPLTKEDIAYLGALIGGLAYHSGRISAAKPFTRLDAMFFLILLANVGTVIVNPNAMWDEGKLEPGLGPYDVISRGAADLLAYWLPFFVGRSLFSSRDDLRVLLVSLGVYGVVYAGLMGVEALLSIPFHVFQLSMVVYGYSPGVSWRWGVMQPSVFMDHGLSIATFMAACLIAVVGLAKAGISMPLLKPRRAWLAIYSGLFLSRNVAGNVYGIVLAAALATLKPKNVARIAVLLALLVVSYPALRMTGLFPYKGILDLAGKFDKERERSLAGRFDEEQYVIDLMGDRFLFGWGNISRVPGAEGLQGWKGGGFEGGLDGYWIIELGIQGAVGLAFRLSFLIVPVFLGARRLSRLRSRKEQTLLAALLAIVAMRSVDLLINGWWNNLPVFLAGALYSFAGSLGTEPRRRRVRPEEQVEEKPVALTSVRSAARPAAAPR